MRHYLDFIGEDIPEYLMEEAFLSGEDEGNYEEES